MAIKIAVQLFIRDYPCHGCMHAITKDRVVITMQCSCSLNHNMYPGSKVQSNKGSLI